VQLYAKIPVIFDLPAFLARKAALAPMAPVSPPAFTMYSYGTAHGLRRNDPPKA
jgi:hypothetical protein